MHDWKLEVMTVDWIAGYGHLHLPFVPHSHSQSIFNFWLYLFVCLSVLSGWLFSGNILIPDLLHSFAFTFSFFSVFFLCIPHKAVYAHTHRIYENTKKNIHTQQQQQQLKIENKLSKLLNYWESPQEDM